MTTNTTTDALASEVIPMTTTHFTARLTATGAHTLAALSG